jgi:hypothetical protein
MIDRLMLSANLISISDTSWREHIFILNYTTTRSLVVYKTIEKTLENTEGTIKNGRAREIGKTSHTRRRKTKEKHKTTCI